MLSAIGLSIALASPAYAYNGNNAASYADNWWNSYNTLQYPKFSDDCTNFVSQSVHNGGYSFVGYPGSTTSDFNWWGALSLSPINTHSWSVAADYYTFLFEDIPGGIPEGAAAGTSTNYYTPNSVVTGDVLFYDWGQGLGVSHATIQVGIGYDPNKPNGQVWYGNYIDEHTNNRYHAFWSLYPYNAADRATTTIYFMHIAASNH
jgi:hypothetical protein